MSWKLCDNAYLIGFHLILIDIRIKNGIYLTSFLLIITKYNMPFSLLDISMPHDSIVVALLGVIGLIIVKLIERAYTKKRNHHKEELELRTELRNQIKFLDEKVDQLIEDLDSLRLKYWEDVELIYQLKTENIKLKSIISTQTVNRRLYELTSGSSSRRKNDTDILHILPEVDDE